MHEVHFVYDDGSQACVYGRSLAEAREKAHALGLYSTTEGWSVTELFIPKRDGMRERLTWGATVLA